MSCSDIVIGTWAAGPMGSSGKSDGPYNRVRDYYVQAQGQTPLLDEDLGGDDNLESAVMWTQSTKDANYTYLRIRKKVGSSVADVSFQAGLEFIWARSCESEKKDKNYRNKKYLYYHKQHPTCRGHANIYPPS